MTLKNSTQLATRLMFMASQCSREAALQPLPIKRELLARARQLTTAFRLAYSPDPDEVRQAAALIEATIDCLVDVITARTQLHHLPKGTP